MMESIKVKIDNYMSQTSKMTKRGKNLKTMNSTMLRIPNIIYPHMKAVRDQWLINRQLIENINDVREARKVGTIATQLSRCFERCESDPRFGNPTRQVPLADDQEFEESQQEQEID